MKKRLAIEGHATRGDEVIEILEMLGGKKKFVVNGNTSSRYRYYIDSDEMINVFTVGNEDLKFAFITFTLEEFLKKFPYKIGDKVIYKSEVLPIIGMKWGDSNNTVIYTMKSNSGTIDCYDSTWMKPHKEETRKDHLVTKEDYEALEVEQEYINDAEKLIDQSADGIMECKDFNSQKMNASFLKKNTNIITKKEDSIIVDIPKGYEFSGVDDNNQKVIFTKIQPEYPKTYEECCSILNLLHNGLMIDVPLHYSPILIYLTKLLICRDAYWKLAGEQMKLGKPWKPDWTDNCIKYTITVAENEIYTDVSYIFNYVLSFPMEEMRDAFLDSEEITQLIEGCKEFL